MSFFYRGFSSFAAVFVLCVGQGIAGHFFGLDGLSIEFGCSTCCGDEVADGEPSDVIRSTPFPEIPIGVTSFGGAVVGDHLYVYGGHCGEAHDYYASGQNAQLLRLNIESPAKWQAVCRSDGLQGLAMVSHKGNLYRVGGFKARNAEGEDQDLHSVAEFAKYDAVSNSWKPLTPMPSARSSLDAVVCGDTLYVIGGWTLSGPGQDPVWSDTALSIDLNEPDLDWKVIKVPFRRRALSVGFFEHQLYVVGGMQQRGGPTTAVNIYDTKTSTWSEGPKLPGDGRMAGFGSSCFNVGGRLIASTYDGSILQLNEARDGWDKIYQLETSRFFHRLLPLSSDKFILVGGANMSTGKILEPEVFSFQPR